MLPLDGLILDMDGVLWHGPDPIPGLTSFFDTLEHLALPFVLATNNSTGTREHFMTKLAGLGVQVAPEQILTSSYATADFLLELTEPGASVYLVGEAGLEDALTTRGFRLSSDNARLVVAGLDRGFSYGKIAIAARLIRNGARFIGTNPDRTLPTPDGLYPGAGTMLAAIAAASGVEPLIVGKPEPLMIQHALRTLGTPPARTAMVGDRLDTDILAGKRAGIKTILVFSGVTQPEHMAASELQPDWAFDDIRALAAALSTHAN
jgi:4-nitrophenyl phosphatase